MADTSHSKCDAARRAGSSPASGISEKDNFGCSFFVVVYFQESSLISDPEWVHACHAKKPALRRSAGFNLPIITGTTEVNT